MQCNRAVRHLWLWTLPLFLFGCLPCGAVDAYQLFGLDRPGGNEVDCLNFAWVEGTGSELYRPWVGSIFGVDSTTFYTARHSRNQTMMAFLLS